MHIGHLPRLVFTVARSAEFFVGCGSIVHAMCFKLSRRQSLKCICSGGSCSSLLLGLPLVGKRRPPPSATMCCRGIRDPGRRNSDTSNTELEGFSVTVVYDVVMGLTKQVR